MLSGVGHQFQATWRSHQLAGRARVGRYSRGVAWGLVKAFVLRYWAILLPSMLIPSVVLLPIFFLLHGVACWIAVGAAGISGPWIVVVMTAVMSGAADSFMGLDAESATADALRGLSRHGWRLANGITIRGDEDIDHLVVGPAGLLVVESKWSRHRWPIGGRSSSFMSNRLSGVLEQVLQNRDDVKAQFKGAIGEAPVRAVCVVWSAEDASADLPSVELDAAVVVRGPALRSWLASLGEVALDQPSIDRIWKAVEDWAALRDKHDRRRSGPPRRTVGNVVVDSFVAPFLGAVAAFYGLVFVARADQLWLDIAGPLLFTVVGFAALRIAPLRRAALGWLAICVGFAVLFLVVVIRDIVR